MSREMVFICRVVEDANSQQSDDVYLFAFETITSYMRWQDSDLEDIASLMYKQYRREFELCNDFFKKVHRIIREKLVSSPNYEEWVSDFDTISSGYFSSSFSRANSDAAEERFYLLNADLVHLALNHTLDQKDPNVRQSEGFFNWDGFSSVIDFLAGKIINCHIADTSDNEAFWTYIFEHSPKMFTNGEACTEKQIKYRKKLLNACAYKPFFEK